MIKIYKFKSGEKVYLYKNKIYSKATTAALFILEYALIQFKKQWDKINEKK